MVEVAVEYSYDAEQPDELSIKPGDVIKNVIMVEGGWWEGELSGKKGMFPDNFVKVVKNSAEVEKREDTKKKQVQASKRQSVRDLANKIKDSVHEGPPMMRKRETAGKKKRAKVVFSYDPENDDELQLAVGDTVEILKQEEEGWWEGSLNGKQGVFPSNFVEILEEGETATTTTTATEAGEKPAGPAEEGNLIKGKKVHGIGLGNIFGDGPIKLRSVTGNVKPGDKPQEPPKTEKRSEESVMRRQKDAKPSEKALVRYSYAAENEDELSLAEGETVNVLEKELEDSGWWRGELNGKVGVFPDNFVELMKEEPATDKAPTPVVPTPQPKPKKPPPPSQPPATAKPPPKLPDKAPSVEVKQEPIKDEKPTPTPMVPGKKPGHPPPPLTKKPTKPSLETPPVKEEEKPKSDLTAGSFEAVETTGDKLTHLTASRPRGPPKRPPSQVFAQNEEERNGDVKDSHWLKESKTSSHPPLHPPHPAREPTQPAVHPAVPEKKEEVHTREKPHAIPTRPPEPSAATAGLHAAIEELRKELQDLRTNSISKAQFNELKAENESLKKELDNVKSTNSRRLKDIMSEVDEEKKIRLATQVEIERIRKLVAESHV